VRPRYDGICWGHSLRRTSNGIGGYGRVDMTEAPRIPPGGIRDLGPINWLIARIGARTIRAPKFHLFEVVGQHRLLFLPWMLFSVMLLGTGKLSRQEKEVVILRVGHLRKCSYELQHHRRIARKRGLDAAVQDKIARYPSASGLTSRQRALLAATDEFVVSRSISPPNWSELSAHLNRRQLIEFCLLAGQYDALAATIQTLRIPLDFPHDG
jgi:AhpD family alkylhydroperoxidase